MGKKLEELSLDELEKLVKKASKLIKEKKKLLQGKDYLEDWSYMLEESFNDEDEKMKVGVEVVKGLQAFLEKNFKPEEFKIIKGEFIGKHSTQFGCITTKYLRDKYSMYYVTSEWGDDFRTTNKDIKGEINSMKDVVKPFSDEDLIKEFKTLDYSNDKRVTEFKEKFLEYLHCLLFEECGEALRDMEDNAFVKQDYFHELAY